MGFDSPLRALVLGARGGIGEALVNQILANGPLHRVIATSRDTTWCAESGLGPNHTRFPLDLTDDESIGALRQHIVETGTNLNLIIDCTGILHDGDLQPERTWRHIERKSMQTVFNTHVFGLGLLIRDLLPLLPRVERTVFATLSARLGSIGDNRLGGWFSYRASKAAQNMMIKTAAIEARNRWPQLILLSLHPGTVTTALSEPFTRRTPSDKLFSPDQAADYLSTVISHRVPSDSGNFYAWDGQSIPW